MKHRILLADDDQHILSALKLGFQELDCEIITANDGQEALQLIVQSLPSLIISDWHMPVLDGLGLFLQVKNSPITRQIPFVFLTTTDDADVRAALLEIGVEDYWNKPFNLREVVVRAKRILSRLGSPEQFRQAVSTDISFSKTAEAGRDDILNDRYKLLDVIGEGGMGRVYRARDLVRDRVVALKLLRKEYVHDETEVRRFAREAAAAMRIKHVNVIETIEYGLVPSGQAYIVMELLQGHSLARHLTLMPLLEMKWIISLIEQVCAAIAAAHAQGVIHRDLKPTNIFIVINDPVHQDLSKPTVKVLDFGIARLQHSSHHSAIEPLTEPNIVLGTPQYLSPEQATSLPQDERTDIYSLGIVCYELLAGAPPFDGGSSVEVMMNHLTKPPRPLDEIIEVESWLSALIMRMLAKDRNARPQSINEVIALIEKYKD